MINESDFIAKLTFLTIEQGGRSTPVLSSYRPQIKFAFNVMQTSGVQLFIDANTAHPGDTVKAMVTLLSPHFFTRRLHPNMEFEFREGNRLIGTGVIIEITNKLLEDE